MSDYQWTPDLTVGDPEIDRQHQDLFRLFHELETAEVCDRALADAIGRLEHYAEHHFAREEALLKRHGYPDFETHVVGHRRFIEWLEAVKRAYDRSAETSFEIGETVNAFLGRWLVDHVRHEDMLYRAFLAERMAAGED